MNLYKISQLAEQDLEDIWVYLAENNQITADKQIGKSQSLKTFRRYTLMYNKATHFLWVFIAKLGVLLFY